ncbi:hypothetical protein Tco_1214638 [Tanacetum coccineum]
MKLLHLYGHHPWVDDDLDEEEAIRATKKKNLENVVEDETLEIDDIVNIKESMNYPLENVIGNLNQRTLRNDLSNWLEDSKPMKTPMSSDTKLTKDEELSAFVPASKRLPKPLTLKRLSVSSDTLKALRT